MDARATVLPGEQAATAPLTREQADGVMRLTLCRSASRNPLSEETLDSLQSAIAAAGADTEIRVVVIAAEGPAFSAGHDLKEVRERRKDADGGRAYFQWLMKKCATLMQAIVNCPKPVIAEVQGVASAAGCQLVASCDLAVASEAARFCTPGVNIGLFCSTPMVALSRNVSRKHAMEMLLTGELMNAETALRFGLVNRVVPAAELRAASDALSAQIASKSPAILKIGKEAFYNQRELSLEDAYAYCSDVMVENLLHRDADEGIGAFIEKRAPRWHGDDE